MRNPVRWVAKGMVIFLLVIVVMAALGVVVMLLWNSLVPPLFHGPPLQYWQAVGLLILSRILFGGLSGRGGRHRHWRQRMWRERWEEMTPEERARLRERYMSHCGHHAPAAAAEPPPPGA
jgi:hypothetical protein